MLRRMKHEGGGQMANKETNCQREIWTNLHSYTLGGNREGIDPPWPLSIGTPLVCQALSVGTRNQTDFMPSNKIKLETPTAAQIDRSPQCKRPK